jgi:hypothetical protein
MNSEPTAAPARVLTVEGWLSLEDEYLPRVCSGEHRYAHPEAKAALVIAARTYVLRAMRDDPDLGRSTPIPNGETFQVFATHATPQCSAAAARTRGVVLRYHARLILANYVAGALWNEGGSRGEDQTNTERWVTYNLGRRGRDVRPTRLSEMTHPGNRGCMSQNFADFLGKQGYGYAPILRYFYGEDVEFAKLRTEGGSGPLAGLVALAAIGLVLAGNGTRRAR